MSSATSTSAVRSKVKAAPDRGGQTEAKRDDSFRVSHFFVLLSLMAATVAVMMARPSSPENLILISLTIGAAGLAAIAFYRTVAPLVDPRAEEEHEPLSARLRADLEREKALTLRSIKELEFDRAMGKVSDQDFEQMAGRLRARAIGIMKQLDASGGVYRQVIEKELAARIQSAPDRRAPEPSVPESSRPEINLRPTKETGERRAEGQLRQEEDGRPELQLRHDCACGSTNDADARFCKNCGAKLAQATR